MEGANPRAGDTSQKAGPDPLASVCSPLLSGLPGDISSLPVYRFWMESLAGNNKMNASVKHCWEHGVENSSSGVPCSRLPTCESPLTSVHKGSIQPSQIAHSTSIPVFWWKEMENVKNCCSAGALSPLFSSLLSGFNSQIKKIMFLGKPCGSTYNREAGDGLAVCRTPNPGKQIPSSKRTCNTFRANAEVPGEK